LGDIKTLAALTHAHLPSPALTHRRPLDQSTPAARVHFWPLVSAAAMGSHGGVVSGPLNTLFHLPVFFSPSVVTSLPRCHFAGSFVFSSASAPALLCVDTLHFSLFSRTLPILLYCRPALSFLFLSFPSRWVEDAPPRITIEQQRRMAGYRAPMKRRIVYSKRRTSLRRDTNRISRRP